MEALFAPVVFCIFSVFCGAALAAFVFVDGYPMGHTGPIRFNPERVVKATIIMAAFVALAIGGGVGIYRNTSRQCAIVPGSRYKVANVGECLCISNHGKLTMKAPDGQFFTCTLRDIEDDE